MKEPTNKIVCNSAELKVEEIQIVRGEDGESVTGNKIVQRFSINESIPLVL